MEGPAGSRLTGTCCLALGRFAARDTGHAFAQQPPRQPCAHLCCVWHGAVRRTGLVSCQPWSRAAVLEPAVVVAPGWDSLWSLCAGSAAAGSCSFLSWPFMGVHVGVSCFKLCWMHPFVCHAWCLLFEQMMIGCLLSHTCSCLKAFQHHPAIRGQIPGVF